MTEEIKETKYPSQYKYFKRMYDTNEEYRNYHKEKALEYYNKIREEQIERYHNDEEYRKKRAVFRRNSYLKKKAREEAKKEEERKAKEQEEEKNQILAEYNIKQLEMKLDEVHIIANS